MTVIGIMIIIGLTTLMLLNRIFNPINELIKEVRRIKEGEIAYKVDIKINNELKMLAEEINDMKTAVWEHTIDDRFSNPITGLPGLLFAIEKIDGKALSRKFLRSENFWGQMNIIDRKFFSKFRSQTG